jgi:hypothetical protein
MRANDPHTRPIFLLPEPPCKRYAIYDLAVSIVESGVVSLVNF